MQPQPLQPTDLRTVTLQAQEWNTVFAVLNTVQALISRMVEQVQAPPPGFEPVVDDG
jgi:hypothetical protein